MGELQVVLPGDSDSSRGVYHLLLIVEEIATTHHCNETHDRLMLGLSTEQSGYYEDSQHPRCSEV